MSVGNTNTNDIKFDYGSFKWLQIIERKERELYYAWLPYMTVKIYNLWKKYAPEEESPTLKDMLEIVNEESIIFTEEEKAYLLNKARNMISKQRK